MSTRLITLLMAAVCALTGMSATYTAPKREFRSAWIATVWALDWPRDANGNAANNTNASVQKAQMIRMLDSLKNNNFNNVCFQVRSMCDAMYQSSYEPWSSYLTGTRGNAPSYDPLAFVVEECHKRGMECHAWVNPYRYSTGSSWNTSLDAEPKNHTLSYSTTTILDPAQQWTIDRITNVCREIISNYDVDGLVFDDYFYPNGIPTTSAAGDYNEWKNSGTSLTMADWRRDNVNRMVKAVYDMIQATKPYVRFGISPAGVACTDSNVASKYGVTTCPSGSSDWQYDGIFSDPLAWITSGTIDYISPQVYWKIGATANYATITPWWEKVAAQFNRHAYISSSISSLGSSSTASDYAEYANQVQLNRDKTTDRNFGAIFYSCKYLYAVNSNSLSAYLKRTVFSKPALVPALTWKSGNNPGKVTNVKYNNGTLSWTGYSGVRYSVYAFPASMSTADFAWQGDYLLDMSYATSFTIPAAYRGEQWQYAVCVLDRVGFEYEPAFSNETPILGDADPVALVSPASGAQLEGDAISFVFAPVTADGYKLQVATASNFSNILFETTSFTASGANLAASCPVALLGKGTFYWRVITNRADYRSATSEVRNFEVTKAPIGTFEEGYVMKQDIDASTYADMNGMRLTNLWVRSVNSNYGNMSFESNGAFNRGFTVADGNIYVTGRSANNSSATAYLDVYSAETGERLQRLNLGSEASVGYYPCNDVMTDAAGNVIISNLSININSSTPLRLFKVNTTNGALTALPALTYTTSNTFRVDHCAVYGDVTSGTYYVFAAQSSGNLVVRWTIKNGAVSATDVATLKSFAPASASSIGIAARIVPVSENVVYVKGSYIYPTRYNFATGAIDSKITNEDLIPAGLNANGFAQFTLGGKNYILYPNGDHNSYFNYILAQNANGDALDQFNPMWILPKQGLGSVYSQTWGAPCLAVKNATATEAFLYLYAPGNGLAAYRLSSTVVKGDVDRNGNVDISDVTLLVNMVLGSTPVDMEVADLDGNGSIDVSDVTALINLILG
ncbi:MAG: family 10 glycosylhydrolase [Bacteroidales bacterium]|nr:family 10 glycosylhydrolase [Bacteroidales bacterium]